MKYSITIFFLLVSSHIIAQQFSMESFVLDTAKVSLGKRGNYNLNSTVFTNRLFYRLLDGNHVSERDVDRMQSRTSPYNNIGYNFDLDAYASFRPDSLFNREMKNHTFYFRLADRQLINAQFSDDFVDFTLMGNRNFAGSEANFDQFNLEISRFQQIQIGAFHHFESGNVVGASIGFLNGEQNQLIDSDFFRVQTEIDGNSLSASSLLTIQQTDTNNTGFLSNNGAGASIDLYFQKMLSSSDGSSRKLTFELQDLGFIRWNANSINYQIDTTYTFEGVFIEDIFNLNDSALSASNPDSLIDDFLGDGSPGAYTYWLPARLMVNYSVHKANGTFYRFGGIYRFQANMLPYIYGQYGKQLKPNLSLAGTLGLGGYGMINLGFESRLHWNWANLDFHIASNNLEGLILPMFSGGTSLFVGVQKRF